MTDRDDRTPAEKAAETRARLGRRLPRSPSAPPRATLAPKTPRATGAPRYAGKRDWGERG